MIAVINDQSYVLNNYYTETSGRLHLFINCEDNPCDIDTLEENILNNNGISLYAENDEDDTAELAANLSGYNKLIHLEKKYDNGAQIYVIIDVESVSELIENLQQQLESAQADIKTLTPQVNNLNSQIAQLNQTLNDMSTELNEKNIIIQNNTSKLEHMELDFQLIQEQNADLASRISILEAMLPKSDIIQPAEEEPSEQE